MEILAGTLDEAVFRGHWGKMLAESVDGHFWAKNAIRGVTDQVAVGKLYEEASKSAEWKG